MRKKRGLLLTAAMGVFTGISCLLGDDIYRDLMKAKKNTEDGDSTERLYPGISLREITLKSLDGLRLHAVLFDEAKEGHNYAVILPDASFTEGKAVPYVKHYMEKGMQVLLPDARGCGKSEGTYIGYGYDDRFDVMSWIHWILKRDPKAHILLHGLGTGAAAALFAGAEHVPVAVYCILSDSCYATLQGYLNRKLRYDSERSSWLPVAVRMLLLRFMTKLRAGYDIKEVTPETAVEHLNIPTLFLHGDADRKVPVETCRSLYRRAGCTRQIGVFLGAGHMESALVASERYFSQVDAFIAKQHPDRL